MANFVLWTLNYLIVPFGFMDGFVICAILFLNTWILDYLSLTKSFMDEFVQL